MVRHGLSIEQLGDLVERPLVSTLATYRRDGSVLLSPIWHEWRDNGFNVCAGSNDVKVRHIRRDGRASIVVYDQERPYRGLELRGMPSVIEDGLLYASVLRRVAVRYLGATDGAAYAETAGERGVIIRLEPGELRTWDFADEEELGG
jgi:PPOX class probable F420-dependent enzyme